ncbi:DUF1073 domain-containing protein [Uliginosibacterium sp. sgz301328]|uniref:DUF1073 domain-containing protein n=1 Tax=Uliginosibacterium sp. sgz301328 TaxID=3243764 RepID=UPI00359EBF11
MTKRHALRKMAERVTRDTSAAMQGQQAQRKSFATGDSFQNFASRVGLGTANQSSFGSYGFDFVSRNRVQMEAAYRSSWICGMAVDVVADDMTRAGIEIHSELDPDNIEKLEQGFERMRIWNCLCATAKWARLYGGAVAVIMVDGQKSDTPLRIETISKDQFKGLLVLDRWLVQPSLENLVQEMGPDVGMPKYYDVVADSMALPNMRIHHSRLIRIDGVELPYWQRISENLWGQSVLERLWDRLLAFDSTTQGAAQLVHKAHLRTYKVEGLRDIIASGGKAFEGLVKQIDHIRMWQTNEGMTLMDTKDEFDAHSYTFSGLDAVLLQFGQQVSGALQIPLVRLFGQSPAGMNATGESDLRTYYDNVAQQQDQLLRPGIHKLLQVMARSILGVDLPSGTDFAFRPLWQMTDEQKATVAKTGTETVTTAFDAGLISAQTALKELRQHSRVTGFFTNITDEDIEAAESEPPPPVEEVTNALANETEQEQSGQDEQG